MCLSKECCFTSGTSLSGHWRRDVIGHFFFYLRFCFCCINECRCKIIHTLKRCDETSRCEVVPAVESTVCSDHCIFTSCHCYHGKERTSSVYRSSTAAISLRCLHVFWLPWRPAMSMTALCVRRAGRGNVMCLSISTISFTLLRWGLSTFSATGAGISSRYSELRWTQSVTTDRRTALGVGYLSKPSYY